MSKVISIATDENDEDVADLDDLNDGNDVLAQLNDTVEDTKDIDYSDYIALIDTGADADVNFSVVGDDTGDSNGHGSSYNLIIIGFLKNSYFSNFFFDSYPNRKNEINNHYPGYIFLFHIY